MFTPKQMDDVHIKIHGQLPNDKSIPLQNRASGQRRWLAGEDIASTIGGLYYINTQQNTRTHTQKRGGDTYKRGYKFGNEGCRHWLNGNGGDKVRLGQHRYDRNCDAASGHGKIRIFYNLQRTKTIMKKGESPYLPSESATAWTWQQTMENM